MDDSTHEQKSDKEIEDDVIKAIHEIDQHSEHSRHSESRAPLYMIMRNHITNSIYKLPKCEMITSSYCDMNMLMMREHDKLPDKTSLNPNDWSNMHECMRISDLRVFAKYGVEIAIDILDQYARGETHDKFLDIEAVSQELKEFKIGNTYTIGGDTFYSSFQRMNKHESLSDLMNKVQMSESQGTNQESDSIEYREKIPLEMTKKLLSILPPQLFEKHNEATGETSDIQQSDIENMTKTVTPDETEEQEEKEENIFATLADTLLQDPRDLPKEYMEIPNKKSKNESV